MARSRAERLLEVEAAGFAAALAGIDIDECPYEASMYNPGNRYRAPLRKAWLKGWDGGRVEVFRRREDERRRQRLVAAEPSDFEKWKAKRIGVKDE